MNEDEYEQCKRDTRDEAIQAAKENAADPALPRYWTKEVAGGREHYDPVSGYTHHESDYDPED